MVESLTMLTKRFLGRALLYVIGSCVLALFAIHYVHIILAEPNHHAIGSFLVSGRAENQHLDPYAMYPGIREIHPYENSTGPAIYDVNLQPPCMLPFFQLFALIQPALGVYVWTLGSALLFSICAAVLMFMFRGTAKAPLILLMLLSEATLGTLRIGENYALMVAIVTLIVCLLRFEKITAAAICIGVLAAIHPNFGLWIALLFVAGHKTMAKLSFYIAASISILPALFYGPSIYVKWIQAVGRDRHSFLLDDLSLTGCSRALDIGTSGWCSPSLSSVRSSDVCMDAMLTP